MRISDWSSDVCSSDLHSSFSASVACRRNSRARNGVSAGRSWRLVRPSAFPLTFPRGCAARAPSSPTRGEEQEGTSCPTSLARQAFVVIGRFQLELGQIGRVVGFHRSEEHTSELQSIMRNSYAVSSWKQKNNNKITP